MHTGPVFFYLYSKFSSICISSKRLSTSYISQKFPLPSLIFPAPIHGHSVSRITLEPSKYIRSTLPGTWSWDLETGPTNYREGKWKIT